MAAFGALKEARFRFICSSGLLGPEIGHLVPTLVAGDLDFGISFNVLNDFNDLSALNDLPELSGSVTGIRNFRIATITVQDPFPTPVFRAEDGTAFRAKHFRAGEKRRYI
jgi:hypothetical protein